MYGANYYGQAYYGEGSAISANVILTLLRATTRFIAGFNRTTRRVT